MSSTMTLERLQVVMEANTKKFNEEIKKVQDQVKSMTDSVNKNVNKVKNAISSITKSVAGLYALSKVGRYIKNSVQSAMEVEASLQQVARTMGESTQSFLKWAETNALSFNMAQSDALKFGATYSNLVSSFLSDATQITGATTELLKASSIIASGTGRTMEDVMERIRSGLLGNTEAIEDLGVNVNVALLETTEAFKRLANGKSWNQLSFQTQQQIRLMAILEQTSSKFGNEVFQNTNSSLQQLVAILKDVALNLGNAFLPVANVVIPLLSKMAMWLRTVTSYFAAFMQALFGYSPKANAGIGGTVNSTIGQVGSLGDSLDSAGTSADKTKKKLQNLLGGFDEINTLNLDDGSSSTGGSSGSGGTGGVGGIDLGGLGDWELDSFGEPDTSGIVAAAQKVREVIKGVVDFIKEHKEIIIALVAGLIAGIATYMAIGAIGGVGSITTAFSLLPLAIAEACAGVLTAVGGMVSAIFSPATAIAAIVGLVVAAFVYLWQTSDSFRQSLIDGWNSLISALTPYFEAFRDLFLLVVDAITTFLTPILIILWDLIVTVVDNVVQIVMSFWNNILAPFIKFIGECVKIIVDGLKDIWNSWKPTFEKIGQIAMYIWNSTLKPLINWVGSTFINGFKNFGNAVKPIFEGLKTMFKGVVDFVVGVFTGDWKRALDGVKNIFKGVWESLEGIVSAVWDGILGLFSKGGQIFSGVVDGIANVFKTIVNSIITGINKVIASPFNTINGLLNKIRSIEVLGIQPFSGMWSVNPLPVPKIPMLAKGGVVDSATLAIIGEAGKEAVVPLENNTGWMSKMASMLAERMPQVGSDSYNGDLILMIDASIIGKVALQQLRKMQRQGNITLIPT